MRRFGSSFGIRAPSTGRGRIPARLRFGFGRTSQTQWLKTGCLGIPWGSVLTSLGERECDGYEFRELISQIGERYSGESGAAVDDCKVFSEITRPNPKSSFSAAPTPPRTDTQNLSQ